MELKDHTHCVAVFDRHEDAEKAIRELLLIIASGTATEVERARAILVGAAMGQVQVHTS